MKKLLQTNPITKSEKVKHFNTGRTGKNGIYLLMKMVNEKLKQNKMDNYGNFRFKEFVDGMKRMKQALNQNNMKITEDTKIKDLIPEGYELKQSYWDQMTTPSGNFIPISIKKKEVKDFDWYVRKYLLKIDKDGLDNLLPLTLRAISFKAGNYASIPFELKIGLLKFICDDMDFYFQEYITHTCSGNETKCTMTIKSICPKEFLESIF